MILSNDFSGFVDVFGVIIFCMVMLIFVQLFFGKEDIGLEGCLMVELLSILNWFFVGFDCLDKWGKFFQLELLVMVIEIFVEFVSLFNVFLSECCVVGFEYFVFKDVLYVVWEVWCIDFKCDYSGMKEFLVKRFFSVNFGICFVCG